MNRKACLIPALLMALSLTFAAVPAWALDVPAPEPLTPSTESESRGLIEEIFSDLVPSWKPGIIPLEIPELKQKTLIPSAW